MTPSLLELGLKFWQIGSFSIGGGYAIIALIEDLLVNQEHWLTMKEYTDIIAISQMTPGPLAINTSSFVGLKQGGILGATIATFSCVITGIVVALSGYRFFNTHRDSFVIMGVLRGLKAVATGLIGSAGAGILLLALTGHNTLNSSINSFDAYAFGIMVVSMFLLRRYKLNSIFVMVLGACAGIAFY